MANPALTPVLVPCLIVGVPLILYLLFLALCAVPYFQRNALYAHKIHTLWWKNINEPEQWGFSKNQVTPFSLTTADKQTLYAWHILPLSLYARHEATLSAQPTGFCHDITKTENFRLLRDDPSAKLIISFHGNAAQLTQGYRAQHYRSLTSSSFSSTTPCHLLAIDYRGFGLSSGSPTERGLVLDAAAAVSWAVRVAGVPPERIVLVGHSLGTAVASGVLEVFSGGADGDGVVGYGEGDGNGDGDGHGRGGGAKQDFAGVVLVAGFSSLPEMLSGYSIAGWVPVLRPLTWWPWLLGAVMRRVVDKWDSAARLKGVVRGVKGRGGRLRLSLVHAKNDWDIPCHEDDRLFKAAVEGLFGDEEGMDEETFAAEKARRTVVRGKDSFVATWKDGDVVIRQELFPHGGHNAILCYTPVVLAVMRAFGSPDESVGN